MPCLVQITFLICGLLCIMISFDTISKRYIVCSKHSFHVIQLGPLSNDPNSLHYGITFTENSGKDTQSIYNTFSARWREISVTRFEHRYWQWQCLRNIFHHFYNALYFQHIQGSWTWPKPSLLFIFIPFK